MVGQTDGGCQELAGTLGTAFGQGSGGKDQLGFGDDVSECLKIGSWLCHASTPTGIAETSKRLLFRINARLGHYRSF